MQQFDNEVKINLDKGGFFFVEKLNLKVHLKLVSGMFMNCFHINSQTPDWVIVGPSYSCYSTRHMRTRAFVV